MEDFKKKILDFIDSKEKEIKDFTVELVRTLSENPPGDESAVAQKIIKKSSIWGLPSPTVLKTCEKRPNLIYDIVNGSRGKRLCFNGHMDTKPVGDISKWDHDPIDPAIIDGRLYGRGSTDMKGAIISLLSAAYAIKQCKIDLGGILTLAFTADEEAGSRFGARVLADNDFKADAVIVAEPSGEETDFDSLGLACRGTLMGKVIVYGTQMHSSISDRPGCVNAGVKLAEVLLAFSRDLKKKISFKKHYLYPQGPTINPGLVLEGGIFYGVVPGEASFLFDLRTIPGMENKILIKEILSFLDDMMKKDRDLKVELVIEKPPLDNLLPAEIEKDHPLVISGIKATEDVLGRKPKLLGVPFVTDGIYFANDMKIKTVPSFGPGLIKLAHKENEYINAKAVIDGAKIFALTAIDYLNG